MTVDTDELEEKIRRIIETVEARGVSKDILKKLRMVNVKDVLYIRDWKGKVAKCDLKLGEACSDKLYALFYNDGREFTICRGCITDLWRMYHIDFYGEDVEPWKSSRKNPEMDPITAFNRDPYR